MNKIIPLLLYLVIGNLVSAQNKFSAFVKDEDSKEALLGVNVFIKGTQIGAATDANGFVEVKDIPTGKFIISFSAIGYEDLEITISIPDTSEHPYDFFLESTTEELEEISVMSTRGSRLIQNEPTRVEVIAGEEVDEKLSMDPSNISMLLNESTGIQVQQISAASANASFRIQGLDGRYTLLLKDGFPLYSGFSGSLSIIQIPPLDLSQVEIIKGSSSTLYGGGAIAGLINLITKSPAPERELSFLLNGTSAKGLDGSGFFSQKFQSYGITLLASRNIQSAYDNNDDKFSDLPEIRRFSINPKFYYYFSENSTLELGATFVNEERLGGSMDYIDNKSDSINYFEENKSDRLSALAKYNLTFGENSEVIVKSSAGYFDRNIGLPDYHFRGKQVSTFSEALYKLAGEKSDWILGLNLWTENFSDQSITLEKKDYSELTIGAFLQNTADLNKTFSIESGIRGDYNSDYGWFFLPRLSVLAKWSNSISSRIGGGLGYNLPDIFIEEAEQLAFRNFLPIDESKVEAERSYGFNFDINYTTILLDKIALSFNNLFFYTQINDPTVLNFNSLNNSYEYSSLDGYYNSKGIETNLKFTLDHLKLFAGYTFINTKANAQNISSEIPLTPKHRLGLILIYEQHENLRIGLEAYYTGKQKLSSGESVRGYWINGLMIEKMYENFSLFLNFENFLDTRQSKFGPMFTGSPDNPVFSEIYAPTDGRIINGGIKIRL